MLPEHAPYPEDGRRIAAVHLLDTPFPIDRAFDYAVPHEAESKIVPGVFVTVPFGNGNRRRIGIVKSVREPDTRDPSGISGNDGQKDKGDKSNNNPKHPVLKPIESVCPGEISLDGEMLALCDYLKEQTLCTFGDAVRAMVPSAGISHLNETWCALPRDPAEPLPRGLSRNALFVLEYLTGRERATYDTLRSRFGTDVGEHLKSLADKKLCRRELVLSDRGELPCVRLYRLEAPTDEIKEAVASGKFRGKQIRGERQIAVLEALLRLDGNGSAEEIDRECGFQAAAQLANLVKKEILSEERIKQDLNPYAPPPPGTPKPVYTLNDEQTAAFGTLCDLADSGEAKAALLFGVTGSGKTCVMVKLIEHVLASGRGAVVLLPEIALTPQSVAIFSKSFGETVAVIHSSLSPSERRDAYLRIRSGQARLVVGTRSAVFAPVKDLGLIVMDEEQEHTYKSDNNPKYHARDVARFRCAYNRALMLLASATPSIESFYKASEGKYTLLKLTHRYGGAVLPRVEIADMRKEAGNGNVTPIGTRLTELLYGNHKAGEQSILFLNRRGYNHFLSCPTCGEAVRCSCCSVAMTYHTNRNTYSEGRLVCHLCGRNQPLPETCPSCGAPHLLKMGFGTQRVEQELGMLLPDAPVLRMDTDSTVTRFSCDEILGKFRRREGEILLGTQMVTKGHDFPGVTLVGVLSADSSLYLDDYRAAERTFAMLTQVIGRAGRGSDPGVALIQTSNPDNDVIKLACAQDYEKFYEREIRLRRLLTFPPFCDIALLTLSGTAEKQVLQKAGEICRELHKCVDTGGKYDDVPLQIFGPFEAPIYRVENKYRMRLVVKCRLNRRTRELFTSFLLAGKDTPGAPALSVDFNPTSL